MLKNKFQITALNLNSTRANILWATAVQTIEKLAGYLVIAVLTRTLLKAELGTMFFALTIAELCATLVNFGTDNYLVRAVATDRPEALRHLSEVLSARVQNTLIGFVILNLAFFVIQPRLSPVLLLVSAYDFLEEIYYCFSAFFTGQRKLIYRLMIAGVFRVLSVGVLSLVAVITRNLFPVLWTRLILDSMLVIASLVVVRRSFGAVHLRFSPRASFSLMRVSVPFFLVNFLTVVHMRFDTVLVGLFLNLSQVANYELGIKMMEVARFIIRPLNSVFYPVFSEYGMRNQWRKLRLRFWQLAALTFGGGIVLAVGMQFFGSGVIAWLFGADYIESVGPTKILFLSVPLMYFTFIATVVANALHLEGRSALLLSIGVALNVGLNLFVIPAFGILGAAWATVVSQAFLALSMLGMVSAALLRTPPPKPPPAGPSAEDFTPPVLS